MWAHVCRESMCFLIEQDFMPVLCNWKTLAWLLSLTKRLKLVTVVCRIALAAFCSTKSPVMFNHKKPLCRPLVKVIGVHDQELTSRRIKEAFLGEVHCCFGFACLISLDIILFT